MTDVTSEAVVETLFAPAEQAMLPRVVDASDSSELVTANALNGQAGNVARLVGGAVGGVLAAVGGIPLVALADAGSFLLAALLAPAAQAAISSSANSR